MDTLTSLSIIALAALIHASFQLGVSLVTLLSSHATGKKMAPRRTLRLVGSFLTGTIVMTALLVSTFAYVAFSLFHRAAPPLIWSIVSGLSIGIGLAVWVFYYRRGDGTSLWLPRSIARFLDERVRATKLSAEAFSLGLTSVIAECVFISAPVIIAALAITTLPTRFQLLGTLLYVAIASLGISMVAVLIGSGHTLSGIQRWREHNKRFLQFAAGSGLIILGFYLYTNEVVLRAVVVTGAQLHG